MTPTIALSIMLAGISVDVASSYWARGLSGLEEASFIPKKMMMKFGYAMGLALSVVAELVTVGAVAALISTYSGALVFLFVAVGIIHTAASLNNTYLVAPSRLNQNRPRVSRNGL
jgi:hypothetical protein